MSEQNRLGIGVMLNRLSGHPSKSAEIFSQSMGKKIEKVFLLNDVLHFVFEDGKGIRIRDDGQSCCETRYMRTDDDLSYFIGSYLMDAEIRSAPDMANNEWGEVHEVQFLLVTTSKGVFTMASHNEHNGYYSGFAIEVEEE